MRHTNHNLVATGKRGGNSEKSHLEIQAQTQNQGSSLFPPLTALSKKHESTTKEGKYGGKSPPETAECGINNGGKSLAIPFCTHIHVEKLDTTVYACNPSTADMEMEPVLVAS